MRPQVRILSTAPISDSDVRVTSLTNNELQIDPREYSSESYASLARAVMVLPSKQGFVGAIPTRRSTFFGPACTVSGDSALQA